MTRRKVKGPNGLVFDLSGLTATGLVGKGNRGYEYVDDDSSEADVPLEKRTVKQLKAHADESGIDLGDATKKEDILAAIAASSTASKQDDGSDEGATPA